MFGSTVLSLLSLASGFASHYNVSWSPRLEIGMVVAGRAFGVKYVGVHGWAYSHSRLCGCCRPTVRGVSERGPVINQGPHHIQNQASIKEVWVLVLGFFVFLPAVSPGFSLALDLRGRLGVLRGNVESTCGNVRTVWMVY